MSRVRAGEVHLGWRAWGEGDVTVVFIHGNLACKEWIAFAAPLFPGGVRVIGIDWRGCGESDRPAATPDYVNYSMRQHASDMLAALDALDIPFCHLATHSTGGFIAARMLLMQPERFGRVFALDPVTPLGLSFNAEQIGLFRAMMASREVTRAVMATAASSLFVPESLAPNSVPRFREGLGAIPSFFEQILEKTFGVAEGIWIGTPFNLNLERESGELERRMKEIRHPHLVLWGEKDGWIPPADLKQMADGRKGRLDSPGRSQTNGGRDAGLPTGDGSWRRAFNESGAARTLRWLFRRLVRRPRRRRKMTVALAS